MYRLPLPAAVAGALLLASCGQPSSTPGLTGTERDAFVSSSISACVSKAQSDPSNASVPAAVVTQYCECSSNKMADTISSAEVAQLNTNPDQAQALLGPRIQAAVMACKPTAPGTPAPQSEPTPEGAPQGSEPPKGAN